MLQPHRVYNLTGEIKPTVTKQITKRRRLVSGTEGERFVDGSVKRAGEKPSWTGGSFLDSEQRDTLAGKRRRRDGASHPCAPAPRSLHPSCSCCIQSSFSLQLPRDRGLGFEEHLGCLSAEVGGSPPHTEVWPTPHSTYPWELLCSRY